MTEETSDRVFVDQVMESLLAAETRELSLMAEVQTYREMVSQLLTTVASHQAQIDRLMWRLKQSPEAPRG